MPTLSLRQALLALIAGVLVLALVPAGVALDRQVARELEERSRSDLAMAPKILADRNATRADALMMHAKEVAGTPGLAEAVSEERREAALRLARASVPEPGEEAVLFGPGGEPWSAAPEDSALLAPTRAGQMPVRFRHVEGRLYRISVAPLRSGDAWRGAAGVRTPVGEATAGTLAGLTQSEVLFYGPGGSLLSGTADWQLPAGFADSAARWAGDGRVHELRTKGGRRYWAAAADLEGAGTAVFLRDAAAEMSLMPSLRQSALLAGLLALAVALVLGGALAARISRPVRALADASERLAEGDFGAPLPDSALREIRRVRRAFASMRDALREKISELTEANRELADRQERLQALQSELIQRDRMAAAGRLVTELAHEIRNPVASVRNCLEVIHERVDPDSELREFSGMAIEELMRMHRLSEQMLDANRPVDPDAEASRPVEVAETVARLARTAETDEELRIDVEGPGDLLAGIGPDALKQVLMNLVENAREALAGTAAGGGGEIRVGVEEARGEEGEPRVRVEVADNGPGIDEGTLPRIFDPFFTTKEQVHGVGLGLFVAQGLVRRNGGRIRAENREGGGARFVLELAAGEEDEAPERDGEEGAS